VLFGKYVAVLCVALLTALVNLTAMTIAVLVSGQAERLFGTTGLSLLTLLEVFGLVLLFAGFFSAVLLVVTSFARSFKEAQAYLVPLMLLSLAPGVVGLFPGLSLAGPLAVVPLLNIVLLSRDLLTGVAQPFWAAVVVVSTAAYAALALFLAARLFGTEAVLYTESGGWGRFFRRRRP
jgi:ABC-2 type transport system permease protein/sodium transport system permease protein